MPKELLFLLWWSPFYWVYHGMMNIIQQIAQWEILMIDALGILVITTVVFIVFRKKIVEGIQS